MNGVFAIIVSLVGLGGIAAYSKGVFGNQKAIQSSSIIILIFGLILLGASAITTIDAGEVGIMVKFGKILDRQLVEGLNFKDIFSNVVKYDVKLKEYTMSIAPEEGVKYGDDSIDGLTSDQLTVKIDSTLWWTPDKANITNIYRFIAKSNTELVNLVIRPAVRTAIRNVTAKYTFTDLIMKRDLYATDILTELLTLIGGKYIIIDQILIRNILPPDAVKRAIEDKLVAQQDLDKKQYELEKTKRDAEIRIEEAKGIAKAQEIIQLRLTPLYVQFKAIETYGKLAGSPNTTFIIMPTDPRGTGMPVILGTR